VALILRNSLLEHRRAAVRAALVVLFATTPLLAQSPPVEKDKSTKAPMARYVPATAKLFVEFRRPREVDETLRQAPAWRLWSAAAAGTINPKKTTDVRTALIDFLGPDSTTNVDEMMKAEIGLIAPSYPDLSSAVWFARLPNPNVLDRWFPRECRQDTAGPGADSFFRMTDGMIVGVREGIVAMARRSEGSHLVRELFRLMVGGDGESLENSPGYRDLVRYLPGKAIAVAYWARKTAGPDDEGVWSRLWPPVERAAVGMSAGDGRIDLAIRGALSTPCPHRALAPHAVDRLMKLPATTVAALATTLDVNRPSEATARDRSSDLWVRALALLGDLRSAATDPAHPLPKLGPHVILAWDQDLSAAGAAPQLALLVETTDARGLDREFEAIIESFVGGEVRTDSTADSAAAPTVTRTTHFGVSIGQASLKGFMEGFLSPVANPAGEVELSWAAHGEWFLVALRREQIERILDAQFGLVPTLANIREVKALRKRQASNASILLLQPDLASDVLQRLVLAGDAPHPTKLDPSLFADSALAEAVRGGRLGIGMQVEQEPGTVVVARVYPDTAADGRLRPDDRIIGVDGRLLDLTSPNADLRRRWAEPPPSAGHTLRVQRDDTTIDVVLKRDEPEPQPSDMLTRSLPAIRELAAALRTIRFASLTVHPTDERHYSALLSLGPVPSPSSVGR
jgi:hypothetical protein